MSDPEFQSPVPALQALASERLGQMLHARRIAIAGYSDRPEAWSNKLVAALQTGGFTGEVFALRPRVEPDGGVRSLTELAHAEVDLLVVALPAAAVNDVVAEAASAGVGGTLIVSAGFAEASEAGRIMQDQLRLAAGSMPVIGPNSVGLISTPANVVATASPFAGRDWSRRSSVAVVSQSGAVGFVLSDELKRHGITPTYYISAGNEAVTQASEIAQHYLNDPEIQAVGIYLESIRDPQALRSLGRSATAKGKSVVVLASGTSSAGKRAAQSHTAAVVGDQLLLNSICRDARIHMVRDEAEFAASLAVRSRPTGSGRRPANVAVLSMSGGAGAILADRLADIGVGIPVFPADLVRSIGEQATFVASAQNPVDIGGMFLRHLPALEDLIRHVAVQETIDAVVVYLTCGDLDQDAYRSVGRTLAELDKPAWFIWAGAAPQALPESDLGGVVFPSISALQLALSSLSVPAPEENPDLAAPAATQRLQQIMALWDQTTGPVLTESAAQPLLTGLGVPYARTWISPAIAPSLRTVSADAFPVVVKIDTPQAPHRARAGLIALGIADAQELDTTVRRLLEHACSQGFELNLANVIVQQQLEPVADFSLGLLRDGSYGDFIVVGPGGADVEREDMERHAVPLPLNPARLVRIRTAAESISGSTVHPQDLANAAGALEALILLDNNVSDADLNPVLVLGGGRLALVDSLIVVGSDHSKKIEVADYAQTH